MPIIFDYFLVCFEGVGLFSRGWGLDRNLLGFLGGVGCKQLEAKAINRVVPPAVYTPAFGRAVAPLARLFNVQAKAWTYPRSNGNGNYNSDGNYNSNCNYKSNGNGNYNYKS